MDFENLKKSVKKIEMPDEMRARVIRNCQSKTLYEAEENTMNRNTTYHWLKKPVFAAAAVSICLCFAGTAAAAGYRGFFKDIRNWKGAVTGTQYEQASEEIEVSAVSAENGVTVFAVMENPDSAPYSELEVFGIDSYQIVDRSGNVIVEGGRTDLFEIANGEAEIKIPLDIASGDYKLVVNAFVGGKKADQPLQIHGTWECGFSI